MKQILIIYKKELRETLRDKRSLFRMVFIPLGMFPLLFGVTTAIQNSATASEQEKELRVGYIAAGPDLGLRATLEKSTDFKLYETPSIDTMKAWIHDNRLDVGVSISATFASNIANLKTDTIFTYGARASQTANERLDSVVTAFEEEMLQQRLQSIHLEKENIKPTVPKFIDTASARETIGKLAGGFLPYIFIIFCYMGCMFPAIDLFTGEKERGSIETLLSAPVDRWKVLIGKMLLIISAGFFSAILSMVGLFLGLKTADSSLGDVVNVALNVLSPVSIAVLVSMLLPLVVFFAGIMIPATVYAKSFKEAATTLQPLNFVVILPAVIGMMPGIELNALTALVPVLNVVLTTKEVIAGTVNWLLFAEVMLSLLAFATIAVIFSLKRFGNEKNILRT